MTGLHLPALTNTQFSGLNTVRQTRFGSSEATADEVDIERSAPSPRKGPLYWLKSSALSALGIAGLFRIVVGANPKRDLDLRQRGWKVFTGFLLYDLAADHATRQGLMNVTDLDTLKDFKIFGIRAGEKTVKAIRTIEKLRPGKGSIIQGLQSIPKNTSFAHKVANAAKLTVIIAGAAETLQELLFDKMEDGLKKTALTFLFSIFIGRLIGKAEKKTE